MKAVILEAFNAKLRVKEVAASGLQSRQVVVQLGASGVCHSDLSMVRGQYPVKPPIILGHEGAGTVLEVGAGVRRVKPGDRVIASFTPVCGECWQCVRGSTHLCESTGAFGAYSRGSVDGEDLPPQGGLGTMAETMTVFEDYLVKVHTDLPDEQLALMGCGVTTGLGASLWTARVTPGSTVAVFGAGGVGIAAIQGARIAGAAEIIAVDPVPAKEKTAKSFGATLFVNPANHDPVEQIRELTAGRGVDYSLEVVGNVETMRQAYFAARRGGTVVYVGALRSDITLELPANDMHAGAKTIVGCANGSAQVRSAYPQMISLAEAGRLDLSSMISRRFSLEGINDAFDAMIAGEVVRSVLIP
jgi:S-(hydroxymethyl)glutathione dehydrogenase/alcohol dehydrogenase